MVKLFAGMLPGGVMDTDLILVVGIVLIVLSLPALLAAYSESRAPRIGGILLLIGAILVVAALTRHVPHYTFADIPRAFARVVGRFTP